MSSLAQEKEVLLRSLDDLERQRAKGKIDEQTYKQLNSEYTARTAQVLRELRGGKRRRPRSSRLAIVGVVSVLALAAGLLLARTFGARLPGQEISGRTPNSASTRAQLEADAQENPQDFLTRIRLARQLLTENDFAGALREFDAAAALNVADPESRAYAGWILYLAGLPDEALSRVDAAIQTNAEYPDARFFRGMILFRGKGDAQSAIPEFQRYLTVQPDSPLADQVRTELEAAVRSQG